MCDNNMFFKGLVTKINDIYKCLPKALAIATFINIDISGTTSKPVPRCANICQPV